MFQNNKSFTLIEILVTIVIIGILAGVIMISTSSSINKAHDSTRRQDMGALARGLRCILLRTATFLKHKRTPLCGIISCINNKK